MGKVFITSEFFGKFSDAGIKILEEAGHTLINPYGHKFLTGQEIIKYSEEADAFICDMEKIDRDVIEHSPNLKVIARRGVGVDSVDVAFAQEKGIAVERTLGVVEAPVAEQVFGFILDFSRNISKHNTLMKSGVWQKLKGSSVDGKVLGIIGMGKIGYEVAKRACAFGMSIIYHDEVVNEKAQEMFGAKKKSLEEVLAQSDFVSLHTPLTDTTRGFINYDIICKMKKTAYLINTARGAVVDEQDLYRAIKEEKIAGVAVDVYAVEPCNTSILKELDNVILTPHTSTFTEEIFVKMDILAAENVVRVLASKWIK